MGKALARITMGLADYQRKRDFKKTPEPKAVKTTSAGRSYVIQKHAASHLHYDFRLELDGVLKSWAVPKGPCLDPKVKRLAMQVEDHPVAYGSFEGTIPQGEYGGGTVMLWDQGEWEPLGDPRKDYAAGNLKFVLHGEKLRGRWVLIRTKRSEGTKGAVQWLLIKERDDEAKPISEGDILEDEPLSVVSSRDLDEIAASGNRVWTSKGEVKKKAARKKTAAAKSKKAMTAEINVAGIKQEMPTRIDVELATLTDKAPEGDEWLHEIKFDGYRMICSKDNDKIRFITRNHNDWTAKLSSLSQAVQQLPCKQAIIDGEIVVLRPDGTTDFQALQNAFRERHSSELRYYVFDLLYLDGKSLADLPLQERKDALQQLLSNQAANDAVQYSEHVIGSGDEFKQQACKLNLEGIVCKRRDRPYIAGRGSDWVKVKCIHDEEFVIGGFTEPSGARSGFGALLVGFYDAKHQLHYAGKVGTGYSDVVLKSLHKQLESLEQTESPFFDLKRKTGDARTAHWVKPELIGQFKYASRTDEDKLRHASFQGLREDKSAKDVTLEKPVPVKKLQAKGKTMKVSETKTGSRARTSKTTKRSKTAGASLDDAKSEYDSESQTFFGERLTHPDKVLYPDQKITKLDIAAYYVSISQWILPQLAHRPIVLVRCPEGISGEHFYQKHPGIGAPAALRTIPIRENTKTENYFVVDDVQGLIAIAQMAGLEIHVWGSKEDKLEEPDRLVFDLDPDPALDWKAVVDAARQIRDFLQELDLKSFVKTTGGKGLHLVVPIDRKTEWDEAKAFCKQVADSVVSADPSRFTSNMSKARRTNKIFLDYLRNGRGATAVAAYSTRARNGATVAMPLDWKELGPGVKPDSFTLEKAAMRLSSLKEDPWAEMKSLKQSLSKPIKQLKSLVLDR